MTTEQTQGQSETRPSEVRSDALLAAAFADYWHGKWPNQTQEVKRLELSAHYRGCRDAFYAGAKAANSENHMTSGGTQSPQGRKGT